VFQDGFLVMDTVYPAAATAICRGSIGELDSKVYLKLPDARFNSASYRYLNLSHRIDGAWALPADGMIGRLIWRTSDGCVYVSRQFVYDVGLRQYSIDLFDAFNGTPLYSYPASCGTKTWSQAGQITELRFDPNENYTGIYVPAMVFHQVIDWITLTKVNQAAIGSPFPVKLALNKDAKQLSMVEYYYTTDPNNPTQHVAQAVPIAPPGPLPPAMDNKIYLPLITREFSGFETIFNWDTTGVAPGDYYLCASLRDNYNQATYCSDVTVQLYLP
jgi:hypothetical protein